MPLVYQRGTAKPLRSELNPLQNNSLGPNSTIDTLNRD